MIENYSFGQDESSPDSVYALVIYDISDNKTRARLCKYLEGFGTRVQKSAFEVRITKAKFNKLKSGVKVYCKDEDSIRIYRLHGQSEVTKYGKNKEMDSETVIFI